MERLLAFRWQGEPLALETRAESGLVTYVLHPRLVEYVETREPAEDTPAEPPVQAASRDAVIAHSRRHYASPRAKAEREIAQQLGHEAPEEEDETSNTVLEDDAVKLNQAALSSPFASTSAASSTAVPHKASSLRRRLENNGLTTEQADKLLSTHSWQRIEQQLGWLPFRNAKNPAAFLAAAIEGSYEEPRLLRHRDSKATDSGTDTNTS